MKSTRFIKFVFTLSILFTCGIAECHDSNRLQSRDLLQLIIGPHDQRSSFPSEIRFPLNVSLCNKNEDKCIVLKHVTRDIPLRALYDNCSQCSESISVYITSESIGSVSKAW
jgi:hypothetical protein